LRSSSFREDSFSEANPRSDFRESKIVNPKDLLNGFREQAVPLETSCLVTTTGEGTQLSPIRLRDAMIKGDVI